MFARKLSRRVHRRLRTGATAVSACLLTAVLPSCKLAELPEQSQLRESALPDGTVIPHSWATPTDDQAVIDGWLQTFNDPQLEALVAEALANNPDLKQLATTVEIARQNVTVVNAQMLPQVGVGAEASWLKDKDINHWGDSQKASGFIAWEADVWGRLRSQTSSAEFTSQATQLDYAYARQSLAATVAKSWYTATEARRVLGIAENAVEIYTKLLDLVKVQRKTGSVGDLNVAEASADLNAAKGNLKLSQALYSEARRNLQLLLGRYPDAEIEIAENYSTVPPRARADVPASLMARRPDLVAAELNVLSAFRAEEAARLNLLPSFSFDVGLGYLQNALIDYLKTNPLLFHPTIGMSVPIYEGGRLEAEIKIATAQQEQATAAYGSALLEAFAEVENTLTNEGMIAERLQIQEAEERDRADSVRIATIQYKAGSIDLLSLLQLQSGLLATQADRVKLQNFQLTNRINLYLALGGDFEN
jgi:NodT family efflux transporter outer membrane factor (OMF) lipoprotein